MHARAISLFNIMSPMIIFSYLCRMMENIDTKQNNNYSLLICFLDLMIINSCGIFLACIAGAQTLVFSVFAGINAIAIVILREWLMRILNIHVNVSWLNVLLKRIISLAVGITVSVTILPIATAIAFITTKRHSAGPVLISAKLRSKNGSEINCLAFRPVGSFINNGVFGKLPLALNLITGPLSLWNISNYEIQQPLMWIQTPDNRGDEDCGGNSVGGIMNDKPNTETKYNYEHTEQTVWQDEE